MKCLILILFIMSLGISVVHAQITVTGTIWDKGRTKALSSVNVMLQNPARRVMYGYAITKDDGTYTLTYNGKADTLLLVVTVFNILE